MTHPGNWKDPNGEDRKAGNDEPRAEGHLRVPRARLRVRNVLHAKHSCRRNPRPLRRLRRQYVRIAFSGPRYSESARITHGGYGAVNRRDADRAAGRGTLVEEGALEGQVEDKGGERREEPPGRASTPARSCTGARAISCCWRRARRGSGYGSDTVEGESASRHEDSLQACGGLGVDSSDSRSTAIDDQGRHHPADEEVLHLLMAGASEPAPTAVGAGRTSAKSTAASDPHRARRPETSSFALGKLTGAPAILKANRVTNCAGHGLSNT